MPRRRLWLWIGSAAAVAAVAGAVLVARQAGSNGAKKNNGRTPPAAPVEIAAVERGPIETHLTTTATLEAQNSAVLVAQRPGQVTSIAVEEGQWVRAGQVLARLDDREAQLAVERAEVEAEVARRESERARSLHAQEFLSQRELDDLELRLRTARVELEQARHHLQQTRLIAPFAGRITDRLIQLGETVVGGRECFRLADFEPLLARVYFPERELATVRVGQPAWLTVDAVSEHEFEAAVTLVRPVVDRASGTFKVTLEVRDPSGVLRPGNFARVRLRTGSITDAVLVPRRALLAEDGEDFVYVARGDSAVRVPLRLGAATGDIVEVLAGVTPGDSVVTVGHGGLKPGTRLRVVAGR